MKILFLGNSYTYFNDMPVIFGALAKENGKNVDVFSVTKGGHYLRQCFEDGDICGMKLAELKKEHHFDVCVLQEQSTYPVRCPELFASDACRIAEYLAPNVDAFLFYATWGRQIGSKFLAESGYTTETMTVALWESYSKAAGAVEEATGKKACLAPVGLHFVAINKLGQPDLYNADLTHPSYAGSCLAALTHYYTIFGEYPTGTECLQLSAEYKALFAAQIQSM